MQCLLLQATLEQASGGVSSGGEVVTEGAAGGAPPVSGGLAPVPVVVEKVWMFFNNFSRASIGIRHHESFACGNITVLVRHLQAPNCSIVGAPEMCLVSSSARQQRLSFRCEKKRCSSLLRTQEGERHQLFKSNVFL